MLFKLFLITEIIYIYMLICKPDFYAAASAFWDFKIKNAARRFRIMEKYAFSGNLLKPQSVIMPVIYIQSI